MDANHWFELGGFVCMLVASAFFAGAETALTGASRARMTALEQDGNKLAKLVLALREKKELLISGLLLGNSFMNIFASALATSVMVQVFGEKGVIISTLVVTVIVFIFAEVMPKTYALMYADRMALLLAIPVKFVIAVFAPVTMTVGKVVGVTFSIFGLDTQGHSETAHEEELRGAIELFKETEVTEPAEHATGTMLRSIIDLAEVTVEQVMIHRKSVNMINTDMPVGQIVDVVLHSAYTRIPVWKGSPDNIVGIVHTKLLFQELRRVNNDLTKFELRNAMMDPWFIPESTTLFDQLQAFRRRREHFAILVDEYGVVTGVITMEDILEEIVGQIDDEHDTAVTGVRPQPDGAYVIDGKVTIRDLNRDLGWKLPAEDYSTVAGLLLFETQRIPAVGQVFSFHDFRFEILKRHRNQITLVRVTPIAPPASELHELKEAYT